MKYSNQKKVGSVHALSNAMLVDNKILMVCNRKTIQGKDVVRPVCICIDNHPNSLCMQLVHSINGIRLNGNETVEEIGEIIVESVNAGMHNARIQFAPPNNTIVSILDSPYYQAKIEDGYEYREEFLKKNGIYLNRNNEDKMVVFELNDYSVMDELIYFAGVRGIEITAIENQIAIDLCQNYSSETIRQCLNHMYSDGCQVKSLIEVTNLIDDSFSDLFTMVA